MLYLPHMKSLLILGRQPALGLAELESLYGAKALRPVGPHAAELDVDPVQVDFDRLGGSTKQAKLLTSLEATDWNAIQKYLIKETPNHAKLLPEGKLTIGISAYGLKTTPQAINAAGLTLKKVIRATGRPVRLVPNKTLELNTAQVLHNNLTQGNAWEILLVRDGTKTIVAQTVRAQDIESYTVRDRERPKRDPRVGMLPPKLAQLLINLAVGELPRHAGSEMEYEDESGASTGEDVVGDHAGVTVLDPFCGTGVVLQEALLMRYAAYGTDIDKRMVEFSRANIDWLARSFELGDFGAVIEQGDATKYRWEHPFTHVAAETYLGRPFTSRPSPEVLAQTVNECNVIIKKFLKNIGGQMPAGTRLCLAVPAWQTRPGQFKHLPILASTSAAKPSAAAKLPATTGQHLDQIGELGYNRMRFEHTSAEDLLYYRPDQVVARELLVLEKV